MAKRVGGDKWLFFVTLLLIVVGLAMVFSASAVVAQERYHSPYTFVGRQAIWALLGVLSCCCSHAHRLQPLQLPALHLSRPVRHHLSAGAGLLHARLAQHPSLDSLRRLLHLPAVGDSPSPCWSSFSPGSSPRASTRCTTGRVPCLRAARHSAALHCVNRCRSPISAPRWSWPASPP